MWTNVHGNLSKDSTFIILWQAAASRSEEWTPSVCGLARAQGTWGVRGRQKSSSAQSSQNLWQTQVTARHLSPQNQWTPNWSGEIRNETKCGGLGLKTARRPATLWGRTGRNPGNRADQDNHPLQWKGLATELCWTKTSVLSATAGRAWRQITFCKTQLPTWSLSKWPRVFSESTNLITNHPLARGKVSSTLSLSAACADANSVPLWTRSTSFWRHHQAPESHSSRDGE